MTVQQSESISALAKALADFQKEMKPIPKSRVVNAGKFSYHYAPAEEIAEAIREQLAGHGLSISQTMGFEEGHDTLTTTLLHESGEWKAGTQRLIKTETPQDQGKVITYARRYSKSAILDINTEEDNDAQDVKPPSRPKTQPAQARPPVAHPRGQSDGTPGTPLITMAQERVIEKLEDDIRLAPLEHKDTSGWSAKQANDYIAHLQELKHNPEAKPIISKPQAGQEDMFNEDEDGE